MATITKTFNPVLGKRLRATVLDDCGNVPAPGTENAQLVTDGFITLTLSTEVEEGTEIITKKADGSLCVNEMTDPSFKRFNVEIEFCGVNPALLAIVANATGYEDWAGDLAGIVISEGTIDKRFALELWTGLAGQACAEGVEEASGYMLLPYLNAGVLGDIEVSGESAVTFSMTGSFSRGGNNWGEGPYDVLLDLTDPENPVHKPLPTPLDAKDHLLILETGMATPPSADDPQPMPAGV